MALTEASKAKVAQMGGKVGYIVAPDIEHHIFLSEWAKNYPGAKLIGPEGLKEKRAQQKDEKIGNDHFDVIFTRQNKGETRIGDDFDAELDYEYVDGHVNRELVFLYRPDKILIEADLMFNLPAREQYSRVPESEKGPAGIFDRLTQARAPRGMPLGPGASTGTCWPRTGRATTRVSRGSMVGTFAP